MEEIHTSPEKPKKKRPVSADGQERPRKRPADEGDAPRPRKRPTDGGDTPRSKKRETNRDGQEELRPRKRPTNIEGSVKPKKHAPQKKETADGHVESGASACGHRGILFFGIFADPHWAEL